MQNQLQSWIKLFITLPLVGNIYVHAAELQNKKNIAEEINDEKKLSLSIMLASDYVSRGISYTDSKPALQLSMDYSVSNNIYTGIWTSNYDFGSAANREVDIYAGYTSTIKNEIAIDMGVAYYFFVNESNLNYSELFLAFSYRLVDAKYWYSDDFGGSGGHATYLEAGLTFSLPRDFQLLVRTGYSDFAPAVGIENYRDYILAVQKNIFNYDVALRATDTDNNQFGDREKVRLVLSVNKTF